MKRELNVVDKDSLKEFETFKKNVKHDLKDELKEEILKDYTITFNGETVRKDDVDSYNALIQKMVDAIFPVEDCGQTFKQEKVGDTFYIFRVRGDGKKYQIYEAYFDKNACKLVSLEAGSFEHINWAMLIWQKAVLDPKYKQIVKDEVQSLSSAAVHFADEILAAQAKLPFDEKKVIPNEP